jgi:replicative DNA helicase
MTRQPQSNLASAPPHDLDAEASVLGAILLTDNVLEKVRDGVGLQAEDFYRERHRLIYRAIATLKDRGDAADALTVTALLQDEGDLDEAGGSEYVHGLVGQVPSLANARQYARIVREHALLRALLRTSHAIQESVLGRKYDGNTIAEQALRAIGDAVRPEDGSASTQEDRLLWAADIAIRAARELKGGHDAYTLLSLAMRNLEANYGSSKARREALHTVAATAILVLARDLPDLP